MHWATDAHAEDLEDRNEDMKTKTCLQAYHRELDWVIMIGSLEI